MVLVCELVDVSKIDRITDKSVAFATLIPTPNCYLVAVVVFAATIHETQINHPKKYTNLLSHTFCHDSNFRTILSLFRYKKGTQ